MNKRIVIFLSSVLGAISSAAIVVSSLASYLAGDTLNSAARLFLCGSSTLMIFCFLAYFSRLRNDEDRKAGMREGFAIVTFGWLAAAAAGMIPFIFCVGMHPCDAFFETLSGFSTTGATVIDKNLVLMDGSTLPDGLESLSHGMLFFRSLTQWLGGMGIVVLSIAVFPLLNVGGQALYNAEMTGLKDSGRGTMRIASTAKILWIVYAVLTITQTAAMRAAGMDLFDALCHSMTTVSTGGFSTKNAGLAYFHNPAAEWIVTVFMVLSASNFLLHYRVISGNPKRYLKDEEFRFFFIVIAFAAAILSAVLFLHGAVNDPLSGETFKNDLSSSVRTACFQTVAMITSTGFAAADYTLWPAAAGCILLVLMFIGGCGGSTAGGIKCVRVLLMAKYAVSEVKKCIFPHISPDIRLNGTRLPLQTVRKTAGFLALYMTIFMVFVIILPILSPGMDMATAVTSSASCICNVGPAFGSLGPSSSYALLTPWAKLAMTFEMLLGRLELYTVLVLLLPSFWRK